MAHVRNYIQPAPRRLYAMLLMITSSTVISFGGLIIRNIEIADAISINNIKPKNNQSRLAVIRI